MKTTILGGILCLAPLAIVAILLGKVYQIGVAVAKPLDQLIPIQTFAGVAFVNILAVALILLLCYVCGLLAKFAMFSNRLQKLDGLLIDLFPPYAVFKGVAGGIATQEGLDMMLKPVLARFDDYEQIAFEIEKGETHSVLFLPGSPSAWSGTSVVAANDRIEHLNIPTHQAMKLMRVFGRGSLVVRDRLEGV